VTRPLIMPLLAVAAICFTAAVVFLPDEAVRAQPAVQPQAAPAVKVKPPTVAVPLNSCVTADCHPGIKQHQVLHGPLNVNACDACHESTDVPKHKFQLKRKPTELCSFCHVIDTGKAPFVHKPIETGECMGCHNPHGGFDRRLLKPNEMGRACATCHKDHDFHGKAFVHGPVAAGECYGCHNAHAGDNKNLLVHTGRDLCLSCHKELEHQLDSYPYLHEPLQKDCVQCHNPHASDFRMMTKAAPVQLCTTSCHDDIRQAVTTATYKHSAVTEKGGCTNCHLPHGGQMARLLKAEPVDVCLKCHDKPIEKEGQVIVAAVADLTDPALYHHGPLKEGDCGGCHQVHGSNESRLLAGHYAKEFYAPFAVERYGLCFSCHQKDMVLLPQTTGVTGFRDGDKNLHYVHVNKVKNGRTCRACHNTHVSKDPQIVRESVKYGSWELPINFKPTATGGSCASGCHQPLRYDRLSPFNDHIEPPGKGPPSKSPATISSKPNGAADEGAQGPTKPDEPEAPQTPKKPGAPGPLGDSRQNGDVP
jgi:predicted CXXCH cytochrome family protein